MMYQLNETFRWPVGQTVAYKTDEMTEPVLLTIATCAATAGETGTARSYGAVQEGRSDDPTIAYYDADHFEATAQRVIDTALPVWIFAEGGLWFGERPTSTEADPPHHLGDLVVKVVGTKLSSWDFIPATEEVEPEPSPREAAQQLIEMLRSAGFTIASEVDEDVEAIGD